MFSGFSETDTGTGRISQCSGGGRRPDRTVITSAGVGRVSRHLYGAEVGGDTRFDETGMRERQRG